MARINFKAALLAATFTDLITASDGVDTMVMGFQITNIDGTNSATATADWTDASDSNTATEICVGSQVVPGDAISPLRQPQLLEPGDKLRAKASADGDLVAFGWAQELTE